MPLPRPPEATLRHAYDLVTRHGTLRGAARATGQAESSLRRHYEMAVTSFALPDARLSAAEYQDEAPPLDEASMPITSGVVVAFGDAHWSHPDQRRSLAHEALLRALPTIKPNLILAMGDLMDFSAISRHDPVGWQARTTVGEEIRAAQLHLEDIRNAAPSAATAWALGNHDERHDNYLARHAPQFEASEGTRLADKFPDWPQAYRWDFGAFRAIHRWHSGIHAAHNNAVKSGVSLVTADTHKLRVTPHDDLTGRRYGVETGMLADPHWPIFRYLRGKPTTWCGGWVVLTIRDGRLLSPEVCEVMNGAAWFRGAEIVDKPRVRVAAGRG